MISVTIDIKITCDECKAEMPPIEGDHYRVARLNRYYAIPIKYRDDWRIKFDRNDKKIKCFCPVHRPPERSKILG